MNADGLGVERWSYTRLILLLSHFLPDYCLFLRYSYLHKVADNFGENNTLVSDGRNTNMEDD